jgi:hypothetical protein
MRVAVAASLGLMGLVLGGACAAEPSGDDQVASTVCEELRLHDNRLVDLVNASVAGISALPAGQRADAIRSGLDHVEIELLAWSERVGEISLDNIDEADALRTQLAVGAGLALEELERQRDLLRSGPIPDGEVQGAVGQWFNSVEKVMSVSEPAIFKFQRREFKQAFLDEPACRNVIQQFVND